MAGKSSRRGAAHRQTMRELYRGVAFVSIMFGALFVYALVG